MREVYDSSSLKVRAYNVLRLAVVPVPWLSGLMTSLRGTVLCLGCGYGTLEAVLAADNRHLEFTASDYNASRIRVAQTSVKHLSNITFEVADATLVRPDHLYDNVLLADLLHHLADGEQEVLLSKMWRTVRPGGALLIKDVDDHPRWKYWWNFAHDMVVAGDPLTYRPMAHYAQLLRDMGAEVFDSVPKTRLPYAHYALLARKSAEDPRVS